MRYLLLLLLLFAVTPDSLTQAIRKGDLARVQAVVAQNPGAINSREPRFGSTPLHTAVAKHQIAIVRFLLEKGADVNAGNDLKITPLHLCAQFNYTDLAILLLDHKADPNLRTKFDVTPLRLALANKNTGIADVIRSRGGRE